MMETTNALIALAALAQANRLAVFRLLVTYAPEGLTAGVIAEKLDLPAATLSFHLKELHRAGLLRQRQDGRFLWYSANVDAMNDLVRYLTENCCMLGSCAPCLPNVQPVALPIPRKGGGAATRKRRAESR